jgi:serine/threonine-protein kinase
VTTPDGGRSVGRYRILGLLGAGAMGEVYLAEDPRIERKLAIKTVRLAGRPNEIEDRSKRLLREARAAGRLLHPNIVTLFDAGEAEGQLYLAFELVEGTDLAGRMEAGPPLSLREVLRIVRQVADALDYAHRQGIVHRDIKPSNILLDTAGRVKVADFGIAKVTGQSTELTMAGSVMGSPQYLSPEQIRGDDLDGRSDIFSLGVVLYELLSGKRPFEGETITTLVYQILHKEPPPVSDLRSIPPRLETLLRNVLAKERAERTATAGQVAEELAAIERELDDETLSAPAAPALAATHVLPRRTGSGGETPASLETTPQSPRPVPPPPLSPIPPPPPPAISTHRSAAPPVPPPIPPPILPAGRAAVATEGMPAKRWVPLVTAIVLVAVVATAAAVGGGWLLFRRLTGSGEHPADTAGQTLAATPTPAPTPEATPASTPADHFGQPAPTPFSPPVETPRERVQLPRFPPAEPSPGHETPPRQELPQRPEVVPVKPSPTPAPPPTPAEPQRPKIEIEGGGEPAPAPEPSRPLPGADRTVRTGLSLAFRVTPPDAMVLLDRTVIGKAKDWSGEKGSQPYLLPGAGEYLIRIRKDGMKEFRVAVQAGETGGVTPIFAQLSPLPAADVEAGDLPVFRVGKGVSFRVRPPMAAVVLVDGQLAGPVMKFSGGLRGGWLELPPGRHRVSVEARGMRRYDVMVEVMPGAIRERERIDVNLLGGGD